jgi:signal transduction histidine kinase
VVRDIVNVEKLGYVAAMIATYEKDDSLPSRAFYIDPAIASMEQVRTWEQEVAKFAKRPTSITDPAIARVYVHQESYQENLSVKAARGGEPVISNEMYDLFVPIVPPLSKPVVEVIQQELGIQQVVAVPFFLEDPTDSGYGRELVGNLFAMKKGIVSREDIELLSAFANQASAAILSERQRVQIQISQELVFQIQRNLTNEDTILQRIAEGVVNKLQYAVCMVATYEALDDSLPSRAFYINPELASMEQVSAWEQEVAKFSVRPVSITNPAIARVYVQQEDYQENLGVKAARTGKPVISNEMYDLFVPIAPHLSKPVVEVIQQELGIQQVVAVPFFLEDPTDSGHRRELVGNLFAFTRSRRFSGNELETLQIFGRQAAAGLKNARVYRQSEDRRQVAQVFGRMAFGASASVHELRGHVGVVRGNVSLLGGTLSQIDIDNEKQQKHRERIQTTKKRLDSMADLLQNLHEPWNQPQDEATDVNDCLLRALSKVFPSAPDWITVTLTEALPHINTARTMLIEAFKVLIKNAAEATQETGSARQIWIGSTLCDSAIVVTIQDNGIGIRREDISKIFDMRWTTKKTGLGFGLFWTRDYIEGLGGNILVESEWQQGTTFRLIIPCHITAA